MCALAVYRLSRSWYVVSLHAEIIRFVEMSFGPTCNFWTGDVHI
jgi:hypothetical protein